jgi:hypothetical protein
MLAQGKQVARVCCGPRRSLRTGAQLICAMEPFVVPR